MEETLEALRKEGVAAGEGLRGLLAAAQADTRMLTLRGHTVSEWRQEEAAKKQEEDRRKGAGRTFCSPVVRYIRMSLALAAADASIKSAARENKKTLCNVLRTGAAGKKRTSRQEKAGRPF